MSNISTKKSARLAAACALALGILSASAHAQVASDEHAFGPAPQWTVACHPRLP
jgi:hypothetical protein